MKRAAKKSLMSKMLFFFLNRPSYQLTAITNNMKSAVNDWVDDSTVANTT
jgi:hypothetical protein